MNNEKNIHSSIQIPAVQQVLDRYAEILSAYLFGSVAENVMNRNSDVDFAVRLKAGLSVEEKHRIRMDLIESLEKLFELQVDVVILNDASLKMVHQVFKRGKLVFVKNNREEEAFRLKKQKEYFDFQYHIEKERRDLRAFYGC